MKKWIIIFALAFSVGFSGPALAQSWGRWQVIYSIKDKTISLDTETITLLLNDSFRIWTKEEFVTIQTLGRRWGRPYKNSQYRGFLSQKDLEAMREENWTGPEYFQYKSHYTYLEINCKTMRSELIKESYSGYGSEYYTITLDPDERSYTDPVPDSFEESLAKSTVTA